MTAVICLDTFLAVLCSVHDGKLPLDAEQRRTLDHDYAEAPLWLIAGPGTGKTHTLVWLVFKRMLVDGVAPHRIILTTFTRKAAAELRSRLILAREKLMEAGLAEAGSIDLSHVYLGTLHSLCAQILQDSRYEPTLRIRVLEDEITQQFFVRRSRNPLTQCDDIAFWQRFGVQGNGAPFPPNTAKRTEEACRLFNRITEMSASVEAMLASGDSAMVQLAGAYNEYVTALHEQHRTDQARLQRHLLEFLDTLAGQQWLGEGFTVLVDEYQDTNPIQERLYFRLAGSTGDLTVVGDDDQSLYRFRGATVESLIKFDWAALVKLDKVPMPLYLHRNRRSHAKVVDWVNRFISYQPDMVGCDQEDPVRAAGKPPLLAESAIEGQYPAVMAIAESSAPLAAPKLRNLIQGLVAEGLVTDYSQIALLTFSTRESSRAIGTYTDCLRAAGIPIYNPRSRTAHIDQRLLALLGALLAILDPDDGPLPRQLPRGVPDYLNWVRATYSGLVADGQYPTLEYYVASSAQAVRQAPCDAAKTMYLSRTEGRRVTFSALLYKLLAHEPFSADLKDAEGGERIKALNLILAEYEALYDDGQIRLVRSAAGYAQVDPWTLYSLYSVFVEGIYDGLNDPEDEEVSIQQGMVNVMTIHQSKGLEFEVVFVLRPDRQPWVGVTQILEDEFDPYTDWPTKPTHRRAQELRAAEDAVRLFFVAYSRAKRLLVLTGSDIQKWDRVLGRTATGSALNSRSALAAAGVHLL